MQILLPVKTYAAQKCVSRTKGLFNLATLLVQLVRSCHAKVFYLEAAVSKYQKYGYRKYKYVVSVFITDSVVDQQGFKLEASPISFKLKQPQKLVKQGISLSKTEQVCINAYNIFVMRFGILQSFPFQIKAVFLYHSCDLSASVQGQQNSTFMIKMKNSADLVSSNLTRVKN